VLVVVLRSVVVRVGAVLGVDQPKGDEGSASALALVPRDVVAKASLLLGGVALKIGVILSVIGAVRMYRHPYSAPHVNYHCLLHLGLAQMNRQQVFCLTLPPTEVFLVSLWALLVRG